MSERTAPALAKIDRLLPKLQALPPSREREDLVQAGDALRRAVSAFHMEAIRFRMFSVDRLLKTIDADAESRHMFNEVRDALETAGFHTRSHTAP